MYRDFSTELSDILYKLSDNQELCKLIGYKDTDPLSKENYPNSLGLIWTKIFPYPKIPTINDEASVYLNVFYDGFRPYNGEYMNNNFYVQIIVHNTLVRIKGGIRYLKIFQELNSMFNVKSGFGIDKMVLDRTKYVYLNNNQYVMMECIYRMSDVNG